MKIFIKYIISTIIIVVSLVLLLMVIRGSKDNPIYYQEEYNTQIGGPYESSGSTSRYITTEAIVKNITFFLTDAEAKFASPDVSKYKNKYFSVFTPGVAFIGVPFYWLGREMGLPQLLTYFSTTLIALLNAFLIAKIARKLGSGFYTSLISGLLFLFATNALSYSLTFTQHHASTFFILLGILNALSPRTLINNICFGVIYSAGLLMDIPNGIIMLPLVFYVLSRQFDIKDVTDKLKLGIKLNFVGLLIGLMPLIALFGYYNYQTTGSYTTLAQFLGRSKDFTNDLQTEVAFTEEKNGISLPFQTRVQLEGLYIFLVSDQRSIFVYSPIVLVGILGLAFAYKLKEIRNKTVLLIAIILSNFLIYTMFGDPTGSWAFGPRYLIPATAILAAGIGIVLDKYKKKAWFIPIFLIITAYSIGVNVLGAMTTTQIPPKVEAVNLPNPIPYTYEYNWQLMTEENLNSSLFYNLYLSDKLTSRDFALLYSALIMGLILILYTVSSFEAKGAKE